MELTAGGPPRARALPRELSARLNPAAVASWTLAFAIVAYLALSEGGYDTIVRSQLGIAVWWIVLLGAVAGILPTRIRAPGWIAIGLLTGFAAWTGLAMGWSESAERSAVELGRIATYLGVLVLAICAQGRAGVRHTINGLASAIGLVTLVAVLSRLHPQAFDVGASASKLTYPLNAGNALAVFAAMGVPLLLAVAIGARTLAGQAVAAAALPVSALCVYLTVSRGGALALVVGLIVFLALVAPRMRALGTLLTATAGAAILISAASQRDALQDGLSNATAVSQGTDMLWLVLVACTGVALLQVAMGLAARHLPSMAARAPKRRTVAFGALGVLALASAIAVGTNAPGGIGDRWQEFKAAPPAVSGGNHEDLFSRLSSADGGGRYQLWQAAGDAHASAPAEGIGPGTFEFWWARNGTLPDVANDARSLYLETLAETGFVGFALLMGLMLWLAIVAVTRSVSAAPGLRLWLAASAGGVAAFLVACALEGVWELAAVAVVVLLLGAVIACGHDDAPDDAAKPPGHHVASRAILSLLSVLALGVIVVPMAGALATNAGREATADGRLTAALEASAAAERLQPYAATPRLERARALEVSGDLSAASASARAATVDEPTNWRTWIALARIDARRGEAASALHALREARRLNPRARLAAR